MLPPTASLTTRCESPSWAGKLKVAVVVYNGVEVLDVNAPIDVFTKAGYIRDHYYIYTVAAKDTFVFTEHCNTILLPRYTFKNCPSPDIVVVPGCDPDRLDELLKDTAFNNRVLAWVKQMGENHEKEIIAVCTGGMLLAKTGLLDNKTATTHYMALEAMQHDFPKVRVVSGVRFTDTLNLVTTGGVTSGLDGALHLIEKYEGKAVADSVANILVYNRNCPMRSN